MASATAPSTPTSALKSPLRRAVTGPASLSEQRRQSLPSGVARQGDVLFTQLGCKLVSFSPERPKPASKSGFRSQLEEQQDGTLPWASRGEEIIAIGQLWVYRAPNGVTFLTVSNAPKPLLKNSQCWCVDNETKFVMCVRDNFWRIELPNGSDNDRQAAEEMKKVLADVLQYETTVCPFNRGHHVELPASPKTLIKKKPWKPKHTPITSPVVRSGDQNGIESDQGDSENGSSCGTSGESADEELSDQGHTHTSLLNSSPDGTITPEHNYLRTPTRPGVLRTLRSVTAPPPQRFKPSQPPEKDLEEEEESVKESDGSAEIDPAERSAEELIEESESESNREPEDVLVEDSEEASGEEAEKVPFKELERTSSIEILPAPKPQHDHELASIASIDSFHSVVSSFQGPTFPFPPSPPLSPPRKQQDLSIDVAKTRQHKRDISELTVTASTFSLEEDNATPTWPSLDGDSPDSLHSAYETLDGDIDSRPPSPFPQLTPPLPSRPSDSPTSTTLRRRPRAYSPLPPVANIYTPGTAAILQKMSSMLLGPPVQLVALMLNIAAKIADGVYRGIHLEGYREDGVRRENYPGAWVWEEVDGDEGEEEIDDYGIVVGEVRRRRGRENEKTGWEID